VINASGLENMDAILPSDASPENALSTLKCRRRGGSEGQGLATDNEIEGWVCLRWELGSPGHEVLDVIIEMARAMKEQFCF
jgi:hypothetical protein